MNFVKKTGQNAAHDKLDIAKILQNNCPRSKS